MATRRDRPPARLTPDQGVALAESYGTFERLRRRHAKLDRVMRRSQAEADDLTRRSRGKITTATARDRVGYHVIWSRWSASYGEVAAVAHRLLRAQPRSLTDLSMIFSALEWMLLTDGVIVDQAAERQVRRFGRALRGLVAGR